MKRIYDLCQYIKSRGFDLNRVGLLSQGTGDDWDNWDVLIRGLNTIRGADNVDVLEECYYIENKLLELDDAGRLFVFKRIFYEYETIFLYVSTSWDRYQIAQKHTDILGEDLVSYCWYIHLVIHHFVARIRICCEGLGYNPETLAGYEIPTDILGYELTKYLTINKERKYKTLPRTHAIAAVNGLLEKLGVNRSIDKVRIAEFIEAVTGGNIEVAGKDTVSYKQPTENAQAAAAELLKKINL